MIEQFYPNAFHLFLIAKENRNMLYFLCQLKRYNFTIPSKFCTLLQNRDYISFIRYNF